MRIGLPARFHDPVLADRTVDLMAACYWFAFAGWGISSLFTGLGTVRELTDPAYELFWGGGIGIVGTIAFVACCSTFLNSRTVERRIRKKVIEMVAVCLLAGLIAVYPILLTVAVLGGDLTRFASLFTGMSFLIFPSWRVRHLYSRIKKLRGVLAEGAGQ